VDPRSLPPQAPPRRMYHTAALAATTAARRMHNCEHTAQSVHTVHVYMAIGIHNMTI